MADDVTAVEVDGSVPTVYPAFPGLHLMPDAARYFGYSAVGAARRPLVKKRLPAAFLASSHNGGCRFGVCMCWTEVSWVQIERVASHRSVFELVRYSVLDWITVRDQRPASYFFAMCQTVSNSAGAATDTTALCVGNARGDTVGGRGLFPGTSRR